MMSHPGGLCVPSLPGPLCAEVAHPLMPLRRQLQLLGVCIPTSKCTVGRALRGAFRGGCGRGRAASTKGCPSRVPLAQQQGTLCRPAGRDVSVVCVCRWSQGIGRQQGRMWRSAAGALSAVDHLPPSPLCPLQANCSSCWCGPCLRHTSPALQHAGRVGSPHVHPAEAGGAVGAAYQPAAACSGACEVACGKTLVCVCMCVMCL